MDSDDIGGVIGFIVVATLIVMAVTVAVFACATVGALYGAGTSLWNYGLAFRRNVSPERVTS